MYITALEVGKILPAFVGDRERLMATNLAPLHASSLNVSATHWMPVGQCFLSLSVVPLFTGAIQWPTPTTRLILSSILNPDLDHSFNFDNDIVKGTTNEITTAHFSVPMFPRPSDEASPSP